MNVRPRRPLAQVAYDELKYRIIRLVLAPGQWISEKSIAEELGLGLTPVRAALARLTNEGLLIVLPRRGYRVPTMTLKATDDLFAAWKVVACEIMRLATMNMTPQLIAAYQQLMAQSSEWAATDERDEIDVWLEVANKQWMFFARIANNGYLLEIFLRLESQLARLFSLTFSSAPHLLIADRREKTMLRILRERDSDAIVGETTRFLDRIHRETRRALTDSSASALLEVAL